jgi:uncharacterized membrane protein YphA (DoxX/SURF4 family)
VTAFLWILQILLALVFLGVGLAKLVRPGPRLESTMPWTRDFPAPVVRTIGTLEVLAAVGLIVPEATGIAPVLTPLAALGLVALMIGAILTHLRRREFPYAAGALVLLVLAATVAIGRF